MPSREEDVQTQPMAPPPATTSDKRPKESSAEVRPQVVETEKGPFAVGSFVEYKSRSSGLWILAKVEAHDASSNTYRLDVQPHAHADRVRHRTPHSPDVAGRERAGGRDRESRR